MVVLSIITAIPVPIMCYEPVKQLYKRGKVSQLFNTLEGISKMNRTNKSMEEIQKEAEMDQYELNFTKLVIKNITTFREKMHLAGLVFKSVFLNKIYLQRFIGYIVVLFIGWVNFFAVTYNSGLIGLPSVQLDVILLSLVEGVMYISSVTFIANLKRKQGILWSNILILMGGIILIILRKTWGDSDNERLVEAIVVCVFIKAPVALLFVLFYTFGAELFPSSMRGTALGLAITLAKALGLTSQP